MRLVSDADGSFESDFTNALSELSIKHVMVPPNVHFQIGTIERHNATWQATCEKTVDSVSASTPAQFRICMNATNSAKNRAMRRCGRPPEQIVFGRTPRFEQTLLSDENDLEADDVPLAERPSYAIAARCEATIAAAQFEADMSLRTSITRKARPGNLDNLQPGMKVGLWRDQGSAGFRRTIGRDGRVRTRAGYLIGTCIGRQDPSTGTNLWIQRGQHIYQASPESVRPPGSQHWYARRTRLATAHSPVGRWQR